MTTPKEALEFTQYRRKQIAELRPWQVGDDMTSISVSAEDTKAGSPKAGDMIARNPKNHADQWLVAAAYFADNFEPAASLQGEDAVERVARIKSLLASFHRNSCYPEAMTGELNDAAERILATGLVPDEAATRADEREKMRNSISTRLNDVLCEMRPDYDDSITGFNEAWDVVRKAFDAAAIRSGGGE